MEPIRWNVIGLPAIADLTPGQYLLTVEVGTGPTAIKRESRFRIAK